MILLISRRVDEGYDLANRLAARFPGEVHLALESGGRARKAKISRLAKQSRSRLVGFLTLDAPAISLYRRVTSPRLRSGDTAVSTVLSIDDVNDDRVVDLINSEIYSVVFNYGTALYKKDTLRKITRPILNIHDGVLPQYRNVHTDFWAYLNRDLQGLGVTVFEINAMIDDGRMVRRRSIRCSDTESFRSVRASLADLRLELTSEIIHDGVARVSLDEGKRDSHPQGRLWPSPRLRHVVRAVVLEVRLAWLRRRAS